MNSFEFYDQFQNLDDAPDRSKNPAKKSGWRHYLEVDQEVAGGGETDA